MSRRLIVASSEAIAQRIAKAITEFQVGRDDTDGQWTVVTLSARWMVILAFWYLTHILAFRTKNRNLTSEEHLNGFIKCPVLRLLVVFTLMGLFMFYGI